jgi:hypothetical protein
MLKHLRLDHKEKCPELLLTMTMKPIPKTNPLFGKKPKVKLTEDEFMSRLIKFIIKTDQPLSIVDNVYFQELVEYLKIDTKLVSRRTLVRRMEDCYIDVKSIMKARLNRLESKYSITCDVWTSKNQISFFGFTIHYIDEHWQLQDELLAFKYLEGEHDGESLSVVSLPHYMLTTHKAMIEVLQEFDICDRLLAVTADNASNNSTMLHTSRVIFKPIIQSPVSVLLGIKLSVCLTL